MKFGLKVGRWYQLETGIFFLKEQELKFFLFIWLCQVLVVGREIFDLRCGTWDLYLWMWTLRCSMWDLVPWLGMKPRPPALGAQSASHWTTSEVPYPVLTQFTKSDLCSWNYACFISATVHILSCEWFCWVIQCNQRKATEAILLDTDRDRSEFTSAKFMVLCWLMFSIYKVNSLPAMNK